MDDDEIVKEIPIIHSTRLKNRLCLFKYPSMHKTTLNELVIRKAFLKPDSEEVQLDMGISIQCPNFDTDRAELIAEEANTVLEKNPSMQFENEIIDKAFLKSRKISENSSKYAAFAYNGKEIHLTVIKNICNFHPEFTYLDRDGKRKKDSTHNDVSSDEEESKSEEVEAVTVRFKKSSVRSNKTTNDNLKALELKSNEEPWVPCEFHPENNPLSKVERLMLLAENVDATNQATSLEDVEYLRVLIPEHEEQAKSTPNLPSHIMSLHALKALPLQEQCRLLLKDVNIIQFQQLLIILSGSEGLTADTLLKVLPRIAVLVQGNWVIKSEELYPQDTFSATSGVPAESMCRARDYVLYLFTKQEYVERRKVSSVMRIPSEELKEIFTGFARLNHNKGWGLALPPDYDFQIMHSDLVQKQKDLWEKRYNQISESLKDNKKKRRKSKSVSEDKIKSGPNCFSSDNDSGTEKNKSPVAAKKIKKNF